MHVAGTPFENDLVMQTREVDHETITYLEKIKFLTSNLLTAHSVPYIGVERGALNLGVDSSWEPLYVDNQVGGYLVLTQSFYLF